MDNTSKAVELLRQAIALLGSEEAGEDEPFAAAAAADAMERMTKPPSRG